jgi:hypothetical protein
MKIASWGGDFFIQLILPALFPVFAFRKIVIKIQSLAFGHAP